MKHELATLNTKKALAASLKRKMCQKPLSKISVSEIVEDCSLNRRTFYYHFDDIYALLEWTCDREAVELLKRSDSCLTWDEGILLLLRYIQQNESLCRCALDGLGRKYLRKFLEGDALSIMGNIVRELANGLDIEVDEKVINFITLFYTSAIAEALITWMSNGLKESPEEMVRLLDITLHGNIEAALKRSVEKPNKSHALIKY